DVGFSRGVIIMRTARFWGTLALLGAFGAAGCDSSGNPQGKPCTDDSTCQTGQVCGQSGTCETVPCTTRASCAGLSTCLATGVCGPKEGSTNRDCGAGKICRDHACSPASSLPACGDGGACAGGKVCNPQSGRCEDCSTTLRCPMSQTCRNGSCVS